MVVYNRTRGRVVAPRLIKAETMGSRMRGLLGRDSLGCDEAMWIGSCNMIHTFFMRFAIDAAFLDRDLRVVRVIDSLPPWRLSPMVFGAGSVLEAAAGSLRGSVEQGDQLEFK